MISELHGTVTYEDGFEHNFVAPLTEEVDEAGCRVYEALIPIHMDAAGNGVWLQKATVNVIPAKSSLRFILDESEGV